MLLGFLDLSLELYLKAIISIELRIVLFVTEYCFDVGDLSRNRGHTQIILSLCLYHQVKGLHCRSFDIGMLIVKSHSLSMHNGGVILAMIE